MAWQDCIDEIQRAAGRTLTDDELIEMQTELQKEIRRRKAEQILETPDDAAMNAARDIASEKKRAAYVKKKNAVLAFRANRKNFEFIATNFAEKPDLGLQAKMVGINSAKVGSQDSVAARQNERLGRFMGGLQHDLQVTNTLEVAKSGLMDREISNALFSIDNPKAGKYSGPEEAMTIAKVIHKYQEVMRTTLNRLGADIRKEIGYIVKQSHDSFKLERAGFQKWKEAILPKLDMERTFDDGRDPDEALQKIYNNIVSGLHLRAKDEISGFTGGAVNLGKRVSEDRVLHFKDADSWYDYHTEFGNGSILEAVVQQMRTASQNIGLMEVFSANYKYVINKTVDDILRSSRFSLEAKQRLAEKYRPGGMLQNYIDEIDGTTRIPSNNMRAAIGSSVRVIQRLSKLGGSIAAQFTDIPVAGSELNYQMGGGLHTGMANLIDEMARGRKSAEKRQLYSGLSVALDELSASAFKHFDAEDNLPGQMSKIQQLFFRLNLQAPATEMVRTAAIRASSHYAALVAKDTFDKLPKEFSRVLSLYGIDSGKWDIIRSVPQKLADGRNYLTAEGIEQVPDDVIANYLKSIDRKVTPYNIREMRDEINTQFRTFFVSRGGIAVNEPGAQTRAMLNQGTRPGSVLGEIDRAIVQFKNYPVGFAVQVVGREIYGRGSDTLADALKNTNGEMLGFAQLMVWTTIFGYGALQLKELMKGREPRTPDTPKEYYDLFRAAMLQGGGLGIYGDFLFGETKNRYGQTPIMSLLGPTAGTANDILDVWRRGLDGDDFAGQSLRTILNNTPFYNLFYVKPVVDYLFVYRLQETLNPGYLRRMEDRVRKEIDSGYIFPPSQYAQ